MKSSLPIAGIPLYDLQKIQNGKWVPFTTLYLGNYIDGDFHENVGSHCGVDISTSQYKENQPDCLAVIQGEVVKVDEKSSSYGKHIVIKHENIPDPDDASKMTTLYSCYLHLSEMNVQQGDKVECGQKIGKTGNTGESTAAHLHFQIDREEAPFHPYWPFTWKESSDAGYDFFTAINKGLNLDKAKQYTIHPMIYIQQYLNGTDNPVVSEGNLVVNNSPATNEEIKTEENSQPEEARINEDNLNNKSIQESQESSLEKVPEDIHNGEGSFPDVPKDHPFAKAISFLAGKKIIGGYQNGNFGLNDDVKRAQLLKILMLAFNIPLVEMSENIKIPFSDITKDDWYTPYILTAVESGYASGYTDGTFQPEKSVNRAEAFKFICGVAKLSPTDIQAMTFTDVEKDSWFANFAAVAEEKKLLDFSQNHFLGENILTRGETAEIIYRILS